MDINRPRGRVKRQSTTVDMDGYRFSGVSFGRSPSNLDEWHGLAEDDAWRILRVTDQMLAYQQQTVDNDTTIRPPNEPPYVPYLSPQWETLRAQAIQVILTGKEAEEYIAHSRHKG